MKPSTGKHEDSSVQNPIMNNSPSRFALFFRLPSSLLYILKEFLILKEFRSLINSSRECFHEIKFQTVFFDLSAAASQRFCLHEEFRKDVKLRIKDQRSQISIQLTQSSLEKGILAAIGGVHSIKIHFLSVLACPEEIHSLKNLHEIHLLACPAVTDVSSLGSVHSLFIELCHELKDISSLGRKNVFVSLSKCSQIRDISSLRTVSSVVLQGCERIVEVDSLRNVPELRISHCSAVLSLSALTHNQSLTVEDSFDLPESSYPSTTVLQRAKISSSLLSDLSIFPSIVSLELISLPRLSSLSSLTPALPHLRSLSLRDCQLISDLTVLSSAQLSSLSIVSCHRIKDFSCLGEATGTLRLIDCPLVEDISGLGTKNRLVEIRDCPRIVSFLSLQKVPQVRLHNCPNLTDLEELREVSRLRLSSCQRVADLSPLSSVSSLQLFSCHSFHSLNGLRRVSQISVFFCNGLTDVSSLGEKEEEEDGEEEDKEKGRNNNRSIKLFGCQMIAEISSLKGIPGLTVSVSGCPRIIPFTIKT
jgi:hypothetical protein